MLEAVRPFMGLRGRFREWHDGFERARSQQGCVSVAVQARVLLGAGRHAHVLGEHTAARAFAQECLTLYREVEDATRRAEALALLGSAAMAQGEYAAARPALEECLALRRSLGCREDLLTTLDLLAELSRLQGDEAAACALEEERGALTREMGGLPAVTARLRSRLRRAWRSGDDAEARSLYAEALRVRQECGDHLPIAELFMRVGELALARGDDVMARRLFEECVAIWRAVGPKAGFDCALRSLAGALRACGDRPAARAAAAESLDLAREFDSTGGMAASLLHVGLIAVDEGEWAEARSCLWQCLTLRQGAGDPWGSAQALEAFAHLAAAQGEAGVSTKWIAAARLFGAAGAMRESLGRPLEPYERVPHCRATARCRAHLGEPAFAAAWAEGRAMTLQEAAALAREEDDDPSALSPQPAVRCP